MTTTRDAIDTTDTAAFAQEWEQWHAGHEARRADKQGFLAITGLYRLSDAPISLPDAPGTWTTSDRGPVVEIGADESLTVEGERVTGRYEFGEIPERGGINAEFDGGVIEVARRGGRDLLRPRRPDNTFLAAYEGNPAYAPDPKWRVHARYNAFDEPRAVTVGASVDELQHVYDSPGQVEFEVDGQTLRLTAFPGHGEGSLIALFTDATSGRTTYAANRVVTIDEVAADGSTVIDFNRAVNLPCAHTDFATCPLPPAENRLAIAVEAGEQLPTSRLIGTPTDYGIVPAQSFGL